MERLQRAGLSLDPKEEIWYMNYQGLVEYVAGDNNPNRIPNSHPLRSWVRGVRSSKKNGYLSREKIRLMEKVGIDWNSQKVTDEKWESHFKKVKEYFSANSVNRLPTSHESYEWLKHQSRRLHQLAPDKAAQILSWTRKTRSEKIFEDTIQQLEDFQKKHGHCVVAKKGCGAGRILISRVMNLRHKYRKGELAKDQIERLQQAGLSLDIKEETWYMNYQGLMEYVAGGNNPNRIPTSLPLRSWVRGVRGSKKNGHLSREKIRLMEKVGIDWSWDSQQVTDEKWESNFKKVKEYFSANGVNRLPTSQESYEWLKHQIRRLHQLTPDKADKILSLNASYRKRVGHSASST
jgi:disulfide oxidoreductase YuzD